jgi:hypothetical protein
MFPRTTLQSTEPEEQMLFVRTFFAFFLVSTTASASQLRLSELDDFGIGHLGPIGQTELGEWEDGKCVCGGSSCRPKYPALADFQLWTSVEPDGKCTVTGYHAPAPTALRDPSGKPLFAVLPATADDIRTRYGKPTHERPPFAGVGYRLLLTYCVTPTGRILTKPEGDNYKGPLRLYTFAFGGGPWLVMLRVLSDNYCFGDGFIPDAHTQH